MSNSHKTIRPFKSDVRVRFAPAMRPVASDLPEVMTVFISTGRVTTVLVDGKPRQIATKALEKA